MPLNPVVYRLSDYADPKRGVGVEVSTRCISEHEVSVGIRALYLTQGEARVLLRRLSKVVNGPKRTRYV